VQKSPVTVVTLVRQERMSTMTTQTAVRDVENECILRSRSCHWDVNGIAHASPAVSSDLQILTHWTALLASAAINRRLEAYVLGLASWLSVRPSVTH